MLPIVQDFPGICLSISHDASSRSNSESQNSQESDHTRIRIIRALTDPNEYQALLAAGRHSTHTVLRHFLQQSHQHITQTPSKRKITLTWRLIIANSIIPLHTTRIRQIRTILRRTPDIRRTTPHNLSHVSPLLKVSIVRLRLAVVVSEVRVFAIVPEFCDDA